MHLSKIWLFLVASAAAVALTFALVMPRPAERVALKEEERRLERACTIANILLRDNARTRVQLAGEFARAAAPDNEPTLRLDSILFAASKGEIISGKENSTGRTALVKLLASFSGTAPDFVLLLDRRGRIVARANKGGKGDDKYGESLKGYFLVDDALAGYLRDDLWVMDGKLFRVAASPVVTRELGWAGAVVVGHAISTDFVRDLAGGLDVAMSFYVNGSAVASSDSSSIHDEVVARRPELESLEPGSDCRDGKGFNVENGGKTYTVLSSRLPGEAGELGAFFSVSVEREASLGFWGTVNSLTSDDLAPGNFPWVLVVGVFILMMGGGLFLLIWQGDRPLKALVNDAQNLAKDAPKLVEESHRGKFGSIARSVNIALDRLRREAKSAQKDLDDLLGPPPAAGAALPAMGPSGLPAPPPPPPPPSEFQFNDGSQGPRGLPGSPPPPAPPVHAQVPPAPVSLPGAKSSPIISPISDTELPTHVAAQQRGFPDMVDNMPTIVSEASQKIASTDSETQHFRDIYEEFLSTKRRCGEAADNLNFERFATKLRKNRDALIARHNCKSVRFQVYVKDGKAALKASPVR